MGSAGYDGDVRFHDALLEIFLRNRRGILYNEVERYRVGSRSGAQSKEKQESSREASGRFGTTYQS